MDIDPNTVKQVTPGFLGALGASFFMKGVWLFRIGLVMPGAALSYYAAPFVARKTDTPEGLAGFAVGLLGMVFVEKIIDTVEDLELGVLVSDWLRKVLGIGGK